MSFLSHYSYCEECGRGYHMYLFMWLSMQNQEKTKNWNKQNQKQKTNKQKITEYYKRSRETGKRKGKSTFIDHFLFANPKPRVLLYLCQTEGTAGRAVWRAIKVLLCSNFSLYVPCGVRVCFFPQCLSPFRLL